MANNTVEIVVKGVDQASAIFQNISSQASRAFGQIESQINAIPDVAIEATVDASQATAQLADIDAAAQEAEGAIRAIPDPSISAGQAVNQIANIDGAAQSAEGAIRAIPDPQVNTAGAMGAFDKLKAKIGESIDAVKNFGKELGKAAGEKFDLGSIAGGMVAGGGIAGIVNSAMEQASQNAKIQVSFDVPQASFQAVKNAASSVQSYGVDAEAALEGVRRQWAMNKDASDAANQQVIKQAGTIATAYAGVDFTELIQESNEMANGLKISDSNALGLVNSLLKAGFPPDQIDIISEYGAQLQRAGFNATDIQNIFSSGIDSSTWNIDNMLDGLKEGRIQMATFGQGIDDATAQILKGSGISAQQLQKWGKDVAAGGEPGKKAMMDVAKALNDVDDSTQKNALGVKIFGTMWEDQGQNLLNTLSGAESGTANLEQNQKNLNDAVKNMDSSPAVEMQNAMSNIQTALAPVFTFIANIVGAVADWAQKNPTLAATITAIVTGIGILIGIFMVLAPILTVISTAATATGLSFMTIAWPILLIIAIIAALIAIGILVYQNWDAIVKWLAEAWNWLKDTAAAVWQALGDAITAAWNWIKDTTAAVWQAISDAISAAWDWIKSTAETVWNGIKDFFKAIWDGIVAVVTWYINTYITILTTAWNLIKTVATTVWNAIKDFFVTIWEGIKAAVGAAVNWVKTTIENIWNGIKTVTSNVWNGIKGALTGVWDGIKSAVGTAFQWISDKIGGIWEGIKSTTARVWDGIVSVIKAPINGIIRLINGLIGALNRVKINIPKVPDWIPGIGGMGGGSIGFNIPSIPYLAAGGLATKATQAVIGEGADDEAVIPLNNKVMARLGSSIASNTPGYTGSGIDYRALAEAIRDSMGDIFDAIIEALGVRVVVESMNVRDDTDIERIARELQRLKDRTKRGRGAVSY